MSTELKYRRGTTAQTNVFTGAEGEVTVDTTRDVVVVHDGTTSGGFPALRQDLNNLPSNIDLTTTGTITANIDAGDVTTLTITGGTAGKFLQTNGSGVLSWQTAASSFDELTGTIANTQFENTDFGDVANVHIGGGALGSYLKTDGSGTLTWGTPDGGGMFKGDNGTIGVGVGDIFRVNEAELNANVTILSTENASATGPISVANTYTLTVEGTLVIL